MRKILTLAAMITLLAAGAAQAALVLGSDYSSVIYMEQNGRSLDLGGGSFDVSKLGQTTLAYVYCVDLEDTITPGKTYDANYTNNGKVHGSTVNHADQVAWLLTNYGMQASGDREMEAALQAAIWHVIDRSLVLDTTGSKWGDHGYYSSGSEILYWYNSFLAGLPSSQKIDDTIINNFFWISPTTGSGRHLIEKQALVAAAATPVPGTLLLLGSGLIGLVGVARFRSARKAS